jgi:dTDP-4-dehydrorhamnose reductase
MRLVIVGSRGMLGRDLEAAAVAAGHVCFGADLPEFDITRDDAQRAALPPCDWLVNCAAFTQVDAAEQRREACLAVNRDGARNLARLCRWRGYALLQLSTDYIFDGRKGTPYLEDDPAHPLGLYGVSKWEGERAVQEEGGDSLIVRTQSLFGLHGPSFVRAILDKLRRTAEPLKVVSDQVSAPTYTMHLAEAILSLMAQPHRGLVHVSATGACSWFEFARAIAARIKPEAEILPIAAADWNAPAPRPAYSVLDNTRFRDWTGRTMPTWERGLDEFLQAWSRGGLSS